MLLSVVYTSNRPRSIDLLASGLVAAVGRGGWELVVVDGYPGRVERGAVPAYLKALGLPLGWYGPPRPAPFPWAVTGFANAMNTGLLRCRGKYALFVHDYTVLPPDALSRWGEVLQASGGRTLFSGGADVYAAPPPDHPDADLKTWELPPTASFVEHWRPDFDLGYWAAPLKFFDETNGIDARADFGAQWAQDNLVFLAAEHGYELRTAGDLNCTQIDHRAWHQGDETANSEWKTWGHLVSAPGKPAWSKWAMNDFNFLVESHRMRTERE